MSSVFDSLPCRGYWDLYSKWHDNSELSLLGDASEKFPDQTEFQSWIVNFQAGVCAKAKNLALVLQWIKRSKQLACWRTSSIQNHLREKISRTMKNRIWWWRQNWNGATILFIWSLKLHRVEPWQDKSAKNSYTERKTEECFQRKTTGSCSRRDACSGRPWHNAERSGRRKKISPGSSILFSIESEGTDWRKTQTVLKASPVTRATTPCLWRARCKRSSCNYRRHPVCRGCKSGNRCICGIRCLFRHAHGEKKPSARPKKEGTQGAVDILRQGNPRLCILKTQIQWILFHGKLKNWDWTLRRDPPRSFQDAPGTKLNSGEKRTIWRHYPKRWTSWAKSLRARIWGTTTWGNLTRSRLCQQSSVEICEKNAHAEQERLKLRWKGYFKKVQQTCYGIDRDWWSNGQAHVFVHDVDLFVTVQLLVETPTVLYRLVSFAQKHGYSFEWKNGETTRLTKNGKTSTCTMDNSVLLVVSRLSSCSSSSLSSTLRSTDQSNYFRKLRTLSDPATTRSDKHACGIPMLRDHDKQATGNREPAYKICLRRDEQGGSNARHFRLVAAFHR